MKRREFLLFAVGVATLTGCGFRLRGINEMHFKSAYVEGGDAALARALREQLGDQRKLAKTPAEAEIIIVIAAQKSEKNILSLDGSGRVREYRINESAQVGARARDGHILLEPVALFAQRDFTYSDSQALAKEAEEAMLRRDMGFELARQVLTRIAYVHP